MPHPSNRAVVGECEPGVTFGRCREVPTREPNFNRIVDTTDLHPVIREISLKTGTPVGLLLADLMKCAGRR